MGGRVMQAVSAGLIGVAGLALAFLMLITVADVGLRAVNPAWRLFGMLDYVEFSLDWVIFLAIPAALLRGQLIVVDVLDGLIAPRRLAQIGMALTFLALLAMASQVVRPALAMLEWEDRTLDLGLLKFWYWLPIWLGLGLSVLAVGWRLIAGKPI